MHSPTTLRRRYCRSENNDWPICKVRRLRKKNAANLHAFGADSGNSGDFGRSLAFLGSDLRVTPRQQIAFAAANIDARTIGSDAVAALRIPHVYHVLYVYTLKRAACLL